MRLFINETFVHILKAGVSIPELPYTSQINAQSNIINQKLTGLILVENGTASQIEELAAVLASRKMKKLEKIVFQPGNYDAVKSAVKGLFKVVRAGGGLVVKDGKVLLIYRLGKWDLPKGKLESNERSLDGAIREVEEECRVMVNPVIKLCSTWHSFRLDEKPSLKKTTWYLMDCLDDSQMKPQLEEDITDIAWFTPQAAKQVLENSYASIREVFKTFEELQKVS